MCRNVTQYLRITKELHGQRFVVRCLTCQGKERDTLRKHGIVACASNYERHGDSSEWVMTVAEAMQ